MKLLRKEVEFFKQKQLLDKAQDQIETAKKEMEKKKGQIMKEKEVHDRLISIFFGDDNETSDRMQQIDHDTSSHSPLPEPRFDSKSWELGKRQAGVF